MLQDSRSILTLTTLAKWRVASGIAEVGGEAVAAKRGWTRMLAWEDRLLSYGR